MRRSMPRPIGPASPVLLASGSPRRRELLELARIPYVVVGQNAHEGVLAGESAGEYVQRVTRAKLASAAASLSDDDRARGSVLLAADTAVVLEGRVLGKPASDEEATGMLRALSGRSHDVMTGFALGDPQGGALLTEQLVVTRVAFRELVDAEIAAYVRSGEGRDKAGGYAMQGGASPMIERIEGSPTNVIGLPTCELVVELRRLGLL
jgi:septum formation protein